MSAAHPPACTCGTARRGTPTLHLPCLALAPPPPSRRGKELKRKTLLELVDYVNSQAGQRVFTEAVMPDVMDMIVRAAGWC